MSAMTMSPTGVALAAGPVRHHARAVSPRPSGLRLTRRGRIVLAAFALGVLGGGLGLGQAVADGPPAAIEVTTYTIAPGDTLWGIAAGVTAPGQDVRDTIATIQDLNNLSDSAIAAGAQLLLPAS